MTGARTEPTLHTLPIHERPAPDAPRDAAGGGDGPPAARRQRMRWLVALLIVVGAAVALWWMLWQPQTVSQPPIAAPKPPPALAPDAEKARYPIEATAAALPPLDASDALMLAALQPLWSNAGIASLVGAQDLVRNFVVTVDNLPRRTLPTKNLPVKPAPGSFGTASAGNGLVIGGSNSLRYGPYVRLLETVDAQGLVQVYVRNYPLFQQAYRELGYPNAHFNDRLVEALDLMLATPESPGALKVVQPKIFYEFEDRAFEQLPAGQKLMLRIGPENAASVKNRLREVRALVTAQAPQATSEPAATRQ